MIRIHKRTPGPAILRTTGANISRSNSLLFNHHRSAYESGARRFDFKSSRGRTYADPTVKAALVEDQHGKCCFCESMIGHISSGDVEHFRPKAEIRDASGALVRRPGYYWMAYRWDNLFLACEGCNRRNKRNLFPLLDPTARLESHLQARSRGLSHEAPVFIRPDEDPETLIEFEFDVPRPRSGSLRGRETIRALGLDRPRLCEQRRQWLINADFYLRILETPDEEPTPGQVERARVASRILSRRTRAEAEYTAATRDLVRRRTTLKLRASAPLAFPLERDELFVLFGWVRR